MNIPGDPMKRQKAAAEANLMNMDAALLELTKYMHWQEDLERAKSYTPLVTKLYSDTIYRLEEARGDNLLKKIEACIALFFPRGRFMFQEDLHNQILRATLKQTLGEDYNMLVERVCRERGWAGPKKNLFTIASRRSGKTTGIASMVAALLVCVPNIQIVVYSVAKRSAEEFVRLVEKYIQMHPSARTMIVNPGGAEMLVLRGRTPGDERRIRSFPSGGNAANVSFSWCGSIFVSFFSKGWQLLIACSVGCIYFIKQSSSKSARVCPKPASLCSGSGNNGSAFQSKL